MKCWSKPLIFLYTGRFLLCIILFFFVLVREIVIVASKFVILVAKVCKILCKAPLVNYLCKMLVETSDISILLVRFSQIWAFNSQISQIFSLLVGLVKTNCQVVNNYSIPMMKLYESLFLSIYITHCELTTSTKWQLKPHIFLFTGKVFYCTTADSILRFCSFPSLIFPSLLRKCSRWFLLVTSKFY